MANQLNYGTTQEGASSVTAETSPDADQQDTIDHGVSIARLHLLVATILFVLGIIGAAIAAFALVVPDMLSGVEFLSYGRLAPASRVLLTDGWAILGLLGLSYFALGRITGEPVKRRVLTTISLFAIAVGATAGAFGILLGLNSGITGQESPLWARAIVAIGAVLAALSIAATAKASDTKLGTAVWYLTAAPLLLSATTILGLIPLPSGISGSVLSAFTNSGFTLFVITASVGLLYFAFSTISGDDTTEQRPVATLGFWSLILVWAFMNGAQLIYTPSPDWLETIAVAFAMGAFVPMLAIAVDIGLMVKGRVGGITDRATLRYATTSAVFLAVATAVNFLLTWRATSAIVQYSTWVQGLSALIILGGASFAIFAGHSVLTRGRASGTSFHFSWSLIGVIVASFGLLAGGVTVGFSWAAGPASQAYANLGRGWKVAADTSTPFLWVAASGLAVFAIAQIVFLIRLSTTSDDDLTVPAKSLAYNLELEGSPRVITWRGLVGGVATVWLLAAFVTALLPQFDTTLAENTLLGDTFRTYPAGSSEAAGRALYVSEGCAECHTQVVRPIGTDVGLGAVSIAGDYANERPTFLGAHRLGPDLMHAADSGIDAARLDDPRSVAPWSSMPSYSYLSDSDMNALVSYMDTLR